MLYFVVCLTIICTDLAPFPCPNLCKLKKPVECRL
uniref:Uncharacterized protein n=1 Tax=Arundo donax TaxID=35708 RepID=A0A0A9H777_ARUDO